MSLVLLKATTLRLLGRSQSACGEIQRRAWSASPSPCKQPSIGDDEQDGRKKSLTRVPSFTDEAKSKLNGKWDKHDVRPMLKNSGQNRAKRKDQKPVSMSPAAAAAAHQLRHQVPKSLTGDRMHEQRRRQKDDTDESIHPWTIKSEKSLTVGSKIGENDLQVKARNVRNWLQKGCAVRVTISGDRSSASNMEQIFEHLEKAADEVGGHALQKRFSGDAGHVMKFILQISKKKVEARRRLEQTTANMTLDNPEPDGEKRDESWYAM